MRCMWKVQINGEVFIEETTRANYAIQCALHKFAKKHGFPYTMTAGLAITVMREDNKKFPISKITRI